MEKLGIYKAVAGVIADIGTVGKDKVNKQQGFKYRSVDDVYSVLNPALAKNKIFILPEILDQKREIRTNKNGTQITWVTLKIKYTLFADDGSFIETVLLGEAMDTGDKAINKAMAIAYKYLCFQVVCIPVEDMDEPDAERPELQGESHKENRSGTQKSSAKKQEAPKEEPVQNNDTSASDSAPMTDQMYQTLLKKMERTGVTEKIILGRKQLKDKKRKYIKEIDIRELKYVMNIYERTKAKQNREVDIG